MPLNAPIPLAIHLDDGSAYAIGTDQIIAEKIFFGTLRRYSATFTLADSDGAQQPMDMTGWQFRHQIGIAVIYKGDAGTVASVVVANADVSAFSIASNIVDWSIDCNTTEFLDAITDPSISKFTQARSELWGRPGVSGPWERLAAWVPKLAGSVFDTSQTPTNTEDTFYTAPQVDALIASKIDIPTGYKLLVTADGQISVVSTS